MDIRALLSPTTTPAPGSGSPTNSSPVPGHGASSAPASSAGATSHHHQQHHNHHNQAHHRNSITRRDSYSQPTLLPAHAHAPAPAPPHSPHHPAAYHHLHPQQQHQPPPPPPPQHHQQHQQQQQQQHYHHHHHHAPPPPPPPPHVVHGAHPSHYHSHPPPPQPLHQQHPHQHLSPPLSHHPPPLIPLRPSVNESPPQSHHPPPLIPIRPLHESPPQSHHPPPLIPLRPSVNDLSQPSHHPPPIIPLRPVNDIRSHSSPAIVPSKKAQSQQFFTSHADALRRESLPVVSEKVVPPAPRHHSLNFLDNPTFTPSPLGGPQAPTSTPSPASLPAPPPPPLHPTSQSRIPSFSSERGPISRTGSTASLITMDEEQRTRSDQGSASRRVSRTKSSASVEMMVREPSPSPKDAAPELFSDDDDDADVNMDENEESTQELDLFEVERMAELIEKLDHAYHKDEVDAEDTPPTYADCVECIGLLRRGFVASKFSKTYEFKERLNDERERMLKIYPLTEEMWTEWLHDWEIHAEDLTAKVAVMDLWSKSVAHEPGSVTLWKGYIRFILRTWREASKRAEAEGGDDEAWAEIFNFDMVNLVVTKAVGETMYNIPKSHEIWNKYCEVQQLTLKGTTQSKTDKVQRLFMDRLRVPHDDIDSTFSAYSSFVTKYYPNSNYEMVMKAANQLYQETKKAVELRNRYEYKLRSSYGQEDEGQAWSKYIEWETARKPINLNLCQALYERCVLRYPSQSAVWEEYMYFMLDKKSNDSAILPLLERATAHCQWSGTLWSHRILAFDVRQQPFESIERIKHQATTSRLMTTPEEIFKVHLAWCGVLKRRGVAKNPEDAEMDEVAEFGLRSTLTEIGSMDPDYRIARLLITFLTEKGEISDAEIEWKNLEAKHAHEYEFWLRYYGWAFRNTGNTGATSVLKKAASCWRELDWPEKIIDIYHTQIEDYGEGTAIEGAMMEIIRLRREVAKRREEEARAVQAQGATNSQPPVDTKGKRRRSSNVEDEEALPHKKARSSEDIEMESIPAVAEEAEGANEASKEDDAASSSKDKNKKTRDREKLTVFAKNLPPDIDELSVRKFFKDCGTINAFHMVVEADNESATASVEFQNAEDVLAAQTRDKKTLKGREIEVQLGYNTTLYVTNFPPTANEKWIRELFKDCGPIVEVRFPSLKYNQHRRFCYAQFEASEDAEKAAKFNGKDVEGFTLVSKLSDPGKKQERSGAVHEGREVFIRNIDYSATEAEVRELFGKYGSIDSIRLVSKGKGNHSGFGFLDYETAESAQASLELDGQKFKGRKLMVVMGLPQGGAPPSKKSSGKTQPKAPNGAAGSPGSATSPMSITVSEAQDPPNWELIRQKTLVVLNVADTVNDSKIRAAFEKYGSLRKVQLRLDHQAALVEFDDVQDAGKASMALDGLEIDGRAIRFGEYKEMLKMGPEKKAKPGENPFVRKKKDQAPTTVTSMAPVRVHRPTPAVRGGKTRMGLGFRSAAKSEATEEAKEGNTKPKTNAEFRQMLLKGKTQAEDKEAKEDTA
ncbi:hypothetical protein Dda_7709 [Drechslerella dactyloides]|uniref:U4/U6 snRNA-associated-splicing factor PRP24 n=1 Tax=Drechslerella dactyloides TaxID=74499 RepID=A0AAD6NH01_DREDA|nr:hypothetical protein Dda_7709 [Drechslerella dactyloides]